MINTARIIITTACPRDCPKCCNKSKLVLDSMESIHKLSDLPQYENIVITGGEPLLIFNRTQKIIWEIRGLFPDSNLYLYTALYSPKIKLLFPYLVGIQYSLHNPFADEDKAGFYRFENKIENSGLSCRLWFDRTIDSDIAIRPCRWDKITSGIMLDDCPLPKNEKLYILKGY